MPRYFESSTNNQGHEYFRELCALCTSGSLNGEELQELDDHLRSCRECAGLLRGYARLVQEVVPVLGDEQEIELATGFDHELAQGKARLLAKLKHPESASGIPNSLVAAHHFQPSRLGARYGITLALASLLIICVALAGYFVGLRARVPANPLEANRSPVVLAPPKTAAATGDEIKRLSTEISRLKTQLAEAKKLTDEFEQSRSRQSETVSRLVDENGRLKADRESISRNLENVQTQVGQLNGQFDQLRRERDDAQLRNTDLNKTVEAFNARLQTLNDTISEQQRLLAADRDIRELMGARDLLLADVFDIDQNGRNKKPFGRIFYTKNKSLIFYAFDLDRQPGLRNAGAFQVWGARAADNRKGSAFNMGIFYMDNEAMRRWVLKFDNPQVLAQIDSIFVTVEPKGGSDKPRGKQLLFASLRGEPNHP